VLRDLASSPSISLVIISGRSRATLEGPLLLGGIPNLSFASSHGHFIELSESLGGASHVVGEDAKPFLAIARTALSAWLSEEAPVGLSLEDNGLSLSVHYRNLLEPSTARLQQVEAAVDEVVEHARGVLEKRAGKCVWELRPRASWGKGQALSWILSTVSALHPSCSVLAAGDDATDEDMFSALNKEKKEGGGRLTCAESIIVAAPLEEGGENGTVRATSATSFVSTPAELARLLECLAQ
jgi:trehalose-phosphatase